ncbi:MAG: hypothetical protein Q4F60_01710 [Candidatus Saccharibacteria bacterium]|nr:hypothetical protein [Candidatus Saccharibacteria bacterium]
MTKADDKTDGIIHENEYGDKKSHGFLRFLIFLVIAAFVAFFWNPILNFSADYVGSLNYSPSTVISELSNKLNLTPLGQAILNGAKPQLDDSDSFNQHCNVEVSSISTIGCYTNRRIYIFNVTNNDLTGIKESTLSHEFLHATWAHLTFFEQYNLTTILQDAYNDEAYHTQLAEDLETYDESERLEEIYVRLGNEFQNLPPELEAHYAQYFHDQDKIADFFDLYHEPFDALEEEYHRLIAEINDLNKEIEAKNTDLSGAGDALNNDIDAYNNCVEGRTNCGKSYSELAAEYDNLISRQNTFQSNLDELNAMIRKYNDLIETYNEKLTAYKSLWGDMNSNPLPEAPEIKSGSSKINQT